MMGMSQVRIRGIIGPPLSPPARRRSLLHVAKCMETLEDLTLRLRIQPGRAHRRANDRGIGLPGRTTAERSRIEAFGDEGSRHRSWNGQIERVQEQWNNAEERQRPDTCTAPDAGTGNELHALPP